MGDSKRRKVRRRSARPGRRSRKAGRAAGSRFALLVALILFAGVAVLGWKGTPSARRPVLTAEEEPVQDWLTPAVLADGLELTGIDPRWAEELTARLARQPGFASGDAAAREALRLDLEELSFVRVVSLRQQPAAEDTGTGGLIVDLELRTPVACVPVGRSFMALDAEGVLLSGLWPAPPRFGAGPLPVIGPLADAGGLFLRARPGDWLAEEEHTDALAAVLSMRAHLTEAERRSLGRVLIDAQSARRVSISEPGIQLALEERRLILFGRSPFTEEPGELDAARKWDSVRSAVRLLDDPDRDWDLVDVRWDRPEIVMREPLVALATPAGPTGPRPR